MKIGRRQIVMLALFSLCLGVVTGWITFMMMFALQILVQR
jgi:hypothetical protein